VQTPDKTEGILYLMVMEPLQAVLKRLQATMINDVLQYVRIRDRSIYRPIFGFYQYIGIAQNG